MEGKAPEIMPWLIVSLENQICLRSELYLGCLRPNFLHSTAFATMIRVGMFCWRIMACVMYVILAKKCVNGLLQVELEVLWLPV